MAHNPTSHCTCCSCTDQVPMAAPVVFTTQAQAQALAQAQAQALAQALAPSLAQALAPSQVPALAAAPVSAELTLKKKWQNDIMSTEHKPMLNTEGVFWCLRASNANLTPVRDQLGIYKCRECIKRTKFAACHINGISLLGVGGTTCKQPTLMNTIGELDLSGRQELVVVTKDTFPSLQYTGPGQYMVPPKFYHPSILPVEVTPQSLADHILPLVPKINSGSLDGLLSWILSQKSREDVPHLIAALEEASPDSKRVYTNSLHWVQGIQAKFPDVLDYASLAPKKKFEIAIFAMMTGHAERDVHFEYQTASAFKGFSESRNIREIVAKMDAQSDPERRMVSAVNRALNKHAVTGKWQVLLWWDGKKYRDDLDIRVRVAGVLICWFCMKTPVGNLNFDAGVSGKEVDPVECITLQNPDTCTIDVQLYTRRTRGDIPFTVLIKQDGVIVRTIERVLPSDFPEQKDFSIGDHTFTECAAPQIGLTAAAARKAAAQDTEFESMFGTMTSQIALASTLPGFLMLHTSDGGAGPALKPTHDAADVGAMFKTLMDGGKPRIGVAMRDVSHTLSELIDRVHNNPTTVIELHLPDHVPGYGAEISAATGKGLRSDTNSTLVPCVYTATHKPPVRVTPDTPTGTARLDETWAPTGHNGLARVIGIVPNFGGKVFFILENAKISADTTTFPSGGGFFPQDLNVDGFKHRSRYCTYHTLLKPQPVSGDMDTGAIGAFMMAKTVTVYINGQKTVVQNR